MTALEPEEVIPAVSVAELERRWNISRNALKARAKAIGVVLTRQGPTLTTWPGDRINDGDRLDLHLKAGGAMASFPGAIAVTSHDHSDSSAPLAVTSHGVGDAGALALIAAALAALPTPPADPLRRARALADAAALGVALSSAELAEVLGLTAATTSRWPDGHSPRPGFTLARQKVGPDVWWTVERQGHASPVRAISSASGRSVGFASCLTVEAVSLPFLSY